MVVTREREGTELGSITSVQIIQRQSVWGSTSSPGLVLTPLTCCCYLFWGGPSLNLGGSDPPGIPTLSITHGTGRGGTTPNMCGWFVVWGQRWKDTSRDLTSTKLAWDATLLCESIVETLFPVLCFI